MLTVLITRGQIIIHSGYFSCSLPVSQGGNSSRQLAGWRAGRVRSGGSQRSAPSQRNRQHRGGRGHGGVVPVQQGWRVLRPSAETKGSCGPRWVLVEVWFVAGSGIIWMWFFFFLPCFKFVAESSPIIRAFVMVWLIVWKMFAGSRHLWLFYKLTGI